MKKILAAAFMVVLMIPVSAMAVSGPTLQGTPKSIKMLAKVRDNGGVLVTHTLVLTAGPNDLNSAKVWVSDSATQGFMNFAAEITMAGSTATGSASNLDIVINTAEVMGLGSSSNTLIGQVPAHGTFTYNDVSGPQAISFDAACDVRAVATVDPVSGMPTRGTILLKLSPVNVVDASGHTFYLTITLPSIVGLPPAI
jgi:uncharacterized protein YdaL